MTLNHLLDFLHLLLWPLHLGRKQKKKKLDLQNCESEPILNIKLILPVIPFLPTIHCVLRSDCRWVLISTSLLSHTTVLYNSLIHSLFVLVLQLTHNSQHITLYLSITSTSHPSAWNQHRLKVGTEIAITNSSRCEACSRFERFCRLRFYCDVDIWVLL